MADNHTRCPHPNDADGCREALQAAYRQDTLTEHCIFEGLTRNFLTCRYVLWECLYPQAKSPLHRKSKHNGKADIQTLEAASKEVIRLGYPRQIPALQETFFEAYHKLIWSAIYRYGLTDAQQPTSDDAYQETRKDLHQHFSKGPSIQWPLAAYIYKVTTNTCKRLFKQEIKHRHPEIPEDEQIQGEIRSSAVLFPAGVVECWEELDHQLCHSPRGDIYNRIILAQQCLEASLTGRRPSAKQLLPAWRILAQISEEYLSRLIAIAARQMKRSAYQGLVPLVADIINQGLAELNQVPILLAAVTGHNLSQVREILATLSRYSDTAVHTRISRIYANLPLPESERPTAREKHQPEKGVRS